MDIDYKILSIYIVFGFIILVGYTKMTINYWGKDKEKSEIWSNRNRNSILKSKWLKYIYMFMITCSFIAGLYLIYYFTTMSKNLTEEMLIYSGSVIFLVFSMVWAFKPFYYSIFVLFMVFFGTLLNLAGVSFNISNTENKNDPMKIIAVFACCILVIQSGLFDFLIWNGLI